MDLASNGNKRYCYSGYSMSDISSSFGFPNYCLIAENLIEVLLTACKVAAPAIKTIIRPVPRAPRERPNLVSALSMNV